MGSGKSRFASPGHPTVRCCASMILFLHNRYRTTGGEERVVEDLLWLVREHLGEEAELLARDSAAIPRTRAALGLLRGGLSPQEVAGAVSRGGAGLVHAHNLQPSFGWRSLAAARREGAAVVLHLHQYRLVCAVGVCFTHGHECTRCHGRNTLPGIALNCRGAVPESAAYALALAAWQRRMISLADVILVPSRFSRERLAELGAQLPSERVHVLAPPLRISPARGDRAPAGGERRRAGPGRPPAEDPARPGGLPDRYALVVSRLAAEKGIDVAIGACRRAGMPLVIAGEGPERARLEALARGAEVRLLGAVDDERLAELRAGAALALAPSLSAETFGVAAAEAMAAGVPVLGSRIGALPEILAEDELVAPGRRGGAGAGDPSPGGQPRRRGARPGEDRGRVRPRGRGGRPEVGIRAGPRSRRGSTALAARAEVRPRAAARTP